MNHDSKLNLPIASLPTLIQKGVSVLKTEHEKKIFLYCSISVLSGLCTKVKGEYRQQRCYPNLFLFVLAPAASGKSVLKYGRDLVYEVHKNVINNSENEIVNYKTKIKEVKKGEKEIAKPPYKVVLIPANCTSAKLYSHLNSNGSATPSIIAESELDTLTVANQSEWGNFSDLLRKCFHNELISYSRKKDDEFIEIFEPKVSVTLSGTPNQLKKFINNAEDGFLSRFMIYTFDNIPEWSSVAPCKSCMNLDDYFRDLSLEVAEYHAFLQSNPFSVQLTKKQWKLLDLFGEENLSDALEFHADSSIAFVKRHALMVYKTCMVLTALRAAENKNKISKIYCSNDDFEIAMELIKESLQNSLKIYSTFPGSNMNSKISMRNFLDHLPSVFTRQEAISIGVENGISIRSADRWLADFLKNDELSKKNGKYLKQ